MPSPEQLVESIKKLATLKSILERKLERLRCEGVGVEQELMAAKAAMEARQAELAQALAEGSTDAP